MLYLFNDGERWFFIHESHLTTFNRVEKKYVGFECGWRIVTVL